MKINIFNPLALNEQGQRQNNEDNCFPKAGTAKANEDIFVVCDGVGGSNKGEIASMIVSREFYKIVNSGTAKQDLLQKGLTKQNAESFLNKVLGMVEQRIDAYVQQNPETKGMASTLTFLMLTEQGVMVGWVGDSRVYHFRKGRIINKTQDHSLVSELVASGEITEEEALKHPKKNVILRAISGGQNATKVEAAIWTDVKKGDYFMLCTDGILEGFDSDSELSALFNTPHPEQVAKEIYGKCSTKSRDNFTMYLIGVESVEGSMKAAPQQPNTYSVTNTADNSVIRSVKAEHKKDVKWIIAAAAVFVLALGSVLGYYIYTNENLSSAKTADEKRKADSLAAKYQELQEELDKKNSQNQGSRTNRESSSTNTTSKSTETPKTEEKKEEAKPTETPKTEEKKDSDDLIQKAKDLLKEGKYDKKLQTDAFEWLKKNPNTEGKAALDELTSNEVKAQLKYSDELAKDGLFYTKSKGAIDNLEFMLTDRPYLNESHKKDINEAITKHKASAAKAQDYTVPTGDTLPKIASNFGRNEQQIKDANPDKKDWDKLNAGEKIKIPAKQ